MRRINLIKKPKQYKKYEGYIAFIRKITILLALFFLLVFVPFYFYLNQKNKELENLYQEKKQLLDFLAKNKEVEVGFLNLKGKHQLLVNFLKDDVNFLPYYNLLLESLKYASQSPEIEKVVIDNKRNVEFSLNFNDTDSFISFLKYAESDIFTDKFNKLYISRINLMSGLNEKTNLVFKGEFKSVNDYEN